MDKDLQFELWSDSTVTQKLFTWLRHRRMVTIPDQLIMARRLKDADQITNLLADLDATKTLEKELLTGEFFTKPQNQPSTKE